MFIDDDAAENCRPRADARSPPDSSWLDFPVCFRLQRAARRGRARVLVIDEINAVADEDFVFDRDAFTDESVARYFAVAAYPDTFLNLDEGADLCAVADLAAIQVDEVINRHVLT